MNIGERLRALREEKSLTQSDLARKAGISDRTVKSYEANKAQITISVIEKISQALSVDKEYFLLSDTHKKQIINHGSYSKLTNSEIEKIKNDQIFIRQLNLSVGAGKSVEVNSIEIYDTDTLIPFSQMLFKVRPKNIENLRCMRVDGYSMIPMLYPDSWVIVDISARFDGDGLYIINFSGSFMVKLLQKKPNGTLRIISVNKDYESYEIGKDSEVAVQIVGKVLRCVI